MILFLFIVINCIVGISFYFYKKNLNVLESFTYWCFAGILVQNYSALLFINFERILLSDVTNFNYASFINRIILMPIIIVWFLTLYLKASSFMKKVMLVAIFSMILLSIEVISESLGLLDYNHWSVWWSYSLFALILLMSLLFSSIFRRYYYRKDRKNEFYI